MTTKLDELIEQLTALRAEIADTLSETAASETDVRLAVNPAWAMQHSVAGAFAWCVTDDGDVAAYVTDAGQITGAPYLPGAISETLGWA